MLPRAHKTRFRKSSLALLLSALVVPAQVRNPSSSATPSGDSTVSATGPLHIPNRSPTPLFQGEQGKQRPEIRYDPKTDTVTLKILVQDPNGYFIPNIRRENFAVYEDGVRQQNATVEIEHAPVTLGLLLEYGGRYPSLNRRLAWEVSGAGTQLLGELGRQDRIAVWTYGDKVMQVVDFSPASAELDRSISTLKPPDVSETNLYDALIFVLNRMKMVNGRKAIVLISSGIDTFSKASYEDARAAAREAGTPIYIINLGPTLRAAVEIQEAPAVLAKLPWQDIENKLSELATASGGRLYSPDSTIDLSSTYDDIMENLRVRYVITYKSTGTENPNAPSKVRVELVDPKTGQPLQIVDANGKPIHANVIFQDTYTPVGTLGPNSR